jgi:flagellar basal body-associated protein FliL
MKPTLNEKFLAWLALLSGISLSIVAEYYSILGLTAIFAAAVLPVVIMGIALGVGKVSATLWLKQNWKVAPWSIRIYLSAAIVVLMIVTGMGSFGFLSKAHSDQNLVSGDVQAKIAVYDEKIKTAKENIDANRKALKQMDESVDQVMGRSQDEKGADKAVALRRGQAKERTRLLSEITAEQKVIAQLSEERAPIAAEVRKVEAEVGPIKYIAAFIYGETDQTILEKAVTWVIILIIIVFDPLAVVLLLSSQISFQNFREREDPSERELQEFADAFNEVFEEKHKPKSINDFVPQPKEYIPDEEGDSPKAPDIVSKATVTESPAKRVDKPKEDAPAYVQNEEQATSNLWSSTTDTISQSEYLNTSMRKLEDHIDEVANLVKTGFLSIDEVPKSIIHEVNLKLNAR